MFGRGLRRLICGLGLSLCAVLAFAQNPQQTKRTAAELMDSIMWNREPVGGPFRLTDHHGKIRRDTDFRGKLMLVYFGYTSCPDICPTDLQAIGLVLEMLGTAAIRVAPIFITLDPERDTRQHLSKYELVSWPIDWPDGQQRRYPSSGRQLSGLLREGSG